MGPKALLQFLDIFAGSQDTDCSFQMNQLFLPKCYVRYVPCHQHSVRGVLGPVLRHFEMCALALLSFAAASLDFL